MGLGSLTDTVGEYPCTRDLCLKSQFAGLAQTRSKEKHSKEKKRKRKDRKSVINGILRNYPDPTIPEECAKGWPIIWADTSAYTHTNPQEGIQLAQS